MSPKALLALTVAISAASAVAVLAGLPVLAERFSLTWGGEFYLWTPLPYVVLVILAIVFGKTAPGATISLSGALVLCGFGVFVTFTTRDAMGIAMLPFVLLVGCAVVLLAQLARWAVTRGMHGRK
jgi:hypothetical protein